MPETTMPAAAEKAKEKAKDKDKAADEHGEGSVKETIESILVAFILAFIFRAFVVEAFVIPTGSMAPTLYGAHMRLRCPDCGYSFDVNYSGGGGHSADGDEPIVPGSAPRAREYHCPNCGYPFPIDNSPDAQPVRFGDRILVLKYLYLFQDPRRWDVVVFKSPWEDGRRHDPVDPEFSQNYIKRLIGKPGESIVILDGDIYVGPPEATAATPELFKIQRKPPHAQDALWRVVFDNDFLPLAHQDRAAAAPFRQPWTPVAPGAGGWDVGDASRLTRTFTFDNLQGGPAAIFFDPAADPECNYLTDHLAYDEAEEQNRMQPWDPHPVSDLKLSAFYRRTAGSGTLQFRLTKNEQCFSARFTPGGVELWRGDVESLSPLVLSGEERVAGPVAVPALAGGGGRPVKVELANVDYRVSVQVDGREVLGFAYDPPVRALFDAFAGDEGRLATKPLVRIEADHQSCTLEHVVLARDVYYINHVPGRHFNASPDNIVHLGKGEYFVLGDNSYISGDARYWDQPVDLRWGERLYAAPGRVPARFMLGKAFYVYWPAGFRPAGIPLGICPDFGEMRFIH